MTFLTVAVFSTILLALQQTRVYGLIGWSLLFIAYPYWALAALALAGVAYYLWRKHP